MNNNFSALVVEDDFVTRLLHLSLLSSQGFRVQAVENGRIAVDLHRAGASFDFILMDMEMPVMDGLEATRTLRNMGVYSTIVGVTSSGSNSANESYLSAGLDCCIAKPLTVEKIRPLLEAGFENIEDKDDYEYDQDEVEDEVEDGYENEEEETESEISWDSRKAEGSEDEDEEFGGYPKGGESDGGDGDDNMVK